MAERAPDDSALAPDTARDHSQSGFRAIAAVAIAVTTVGVLPVFLSGALAVQMRNDLGFSVSALGALVAAFFFSSMLSSSIAGRTVEKAGATLGMRSGVLLAAGACLGISFSSSWWLLLVFLLLGGVGNATGQVAANLFVADEVPVRRRGFAFGIKQSGVPAATLLGGLAVPTLGLHLGWEWTFRIFAVGGAAIALVIRDYGRRRATTDVVDAERGIDSPLWILVLLALGAGLGAASANSLGAFYVDSGVHRGHEIATVGALFAAGSAMGVAARLGVGWAADHVSGGRLRWVAFMLVTGAIGYGLLATGDAWSLVPATALCFAGGWGWPGLFNFAVVLRNPGAPAAATGITQTGAYAGGIVGPFLFGILAERSYDVAWAAAAAGALVAAVSVLWGRRLLLRHAGEPAPTTGGQLPGF